METILVGRRGARRLRSAGLRTALTLVLSLGGGYSVFGKDVTLTFTAAGTMAEKGVWTVDGQPGSQADLAAGDTLVVETGSLDGKFIGFNGFSTPRLAAFRRVGKGAVNFCNLKLNLQDGGARTT